MSRINERYYISSGELNRMYTLRVRFQEPVGIVGPRGTQIAGMANRDWYVCNLSTDKQLAAEKAQEKVGGRFEVTFDLGEQKERSESRNDGLPVDVLRFGKYFGQTVEEVRLHDPKYLMWVADNFTSEKHEQMIEYIKLVMAPELEERQRKYEEQINRDQELEVQRTEFLKEIGEALVQLPWDFPQNIGKDLIKGQLPKGRGKHLVCDMMGKIQGRRNSKKYKAEYARVEEMVEKAEAIQ